MLSEKVGCLVALLQRFTAGLLISIFLFCVPTVNGSTGERNVEEITGVVVAYDGLISTFCSDICKAFLIIRINVAEEAKPRYIQVDLTFRHKFPKELFTGKKRWRFKLIRTPSLDENLNEFLLGESALGKEIKIPIWVLVPGAEDEKLPFGKVLHSYSLVKNGFRLIPN
ncbi:MAG: hypothetical protein ACREA2_09950 [Blastocatellia bacterium]